MIKYFRHKYKAFKAWMHYNPPGALTSDGWYYFNKEFKANAPIRFWLDKNFKRTFIYPIKWKYEGITNWMRYRTIDRYNVVKTGLEPGYYERDTLILHANFNLLVSYVETALAWKHYWAEKQPDSWKREHIPFYNYIKPLRRPDIGIKHLEWEMTLDDPSLPPFQQSPLQAKRAREVYALYDWWVNKRPARNAINPIRPGTDDDDDEFVFLTRPKNRNSKEYKRYLKQLDELHRQEGKWQKEDDAMLIRLMKIRRGLWS